MPILHLRAVPSDLMARLKHSAREADDPVDTHALDLILAALNARDARRRGGLARAQKMTEQERAESASRAARARHRG